MQDDKSYTSRQTLQSEPTLMTGVKEDKVESPWSAEAQMLWWSFVIFLTWPIPNFLIVIISLQQSSNTPKSLSSSIINAALVH